MTTSDPVVCAIDTAWSWWVWVEEEVRGNVPSVAQASHPVLQGLVHGWGCNTRLAGFADAASGTVLPWGKHETEDTYLGGP
jgi:hypothetical protein